MHQGSSTRTTTATGASYRCHYRGPLYPTAFFYHYQLPVLGGGGCARKGFRKKDFYPSVSTSPTWKEKSFSSIP